MWDSLQRPVSREDIKYFKGWDINDRPKEWYDGPPWEASMCRRREHAIRKHKRCVLYYPKMYSIPLENKMYIYVSNTKKKVIKKRIYRRMSEIELKSSRPS